MRQFLIHKIRSWREIKSVLHAAKHLIPLLAHSSPRNTRNDLSRKMEVNPDQHRVAQTPQNKTIIFFKET